MGELRFLPINILLRTQNSENVQINFSGLAGTHSCPGICYSQKMGMTANYKSFKHFISVLSLFSLLAIGTATPAQQAPAASATPPPTSTADFTAAADEVLQNMSEITGLTLKTPLKKTLRSRDEIRAYVIRQMDEDKNVAQRYADAKSAEAFGLLPKNFDLDSFMVELLTEQIAGLYDPKAHEFYIADWIPSRRPAHGHGPRTNPRPRRPALSD